MRVHLTLPFPPTLNNLYPSTRDGRRYLSKEGKAYMEEVFYSVREQGNPQFGGDLIRASYCFFPLRKNFGDLSNRLKALEDAMEKASVYLNDRQIKEYQRIMLGPCVHKARVEIVLETLVKPFRSTDPFAWHRVNLEQYYDNQNKTNGSTAAITTSDSPS